MTEMLPDYPGTPRQKETDQKTISGVIELEGGATILVPIFHKALYYLV